jgi:hypothetical protein
LPNLGWCAKKTHKKREKLTKIAFYKMHFLMKREAKPLELEVSLKSRFLLIEMDILKLSQNKKGLSYFVTALVKVWIL